MRIKEKIKLLLNSDSRIVELWSGLQGFGASFLTYIMSHTYPDWLTLLCSVGGVAQVWAVLKWNVFYRHWTNWINAVLLGWLMIFISEGLPVSGLEFGGYGLLFVQTLWASYVTKGEVERIRVK